MEQNKPLTFNELKLRKTIQGIFQGHIVTLKVNIHPTTEDTESVQLTGKWNGYVIKSDYLFTDADIESIEQNITFI